MADKVHLGIGMGGVDLPLGLIIRGQGGFYYVKPHESEGIVECRARSKIKKDLGELLVGDQVEITLIPGGDGVIEGLLPRRNKLVRPAISNIDQVLTVFSLNSPDPIPMFMDKLLISVRAMGLEPVIVFTKADIATPENLALTDVYRQAGYMVHVTSRKTGNGIADLKQALSGRVSVLAGPSGVGKSALMNVLQNHSVLRIGDISDKIRRGKHTTRHASLLPLEAGGWIADTPGFSVLDLTMIKKPELPGFYQEFGPFAQDCRFMGCMHRAEPSCAVKTAVANREVSPLRYENYLALLTEIEALPPEWARKGDT